MADGFGLEETPEVFEEMDNQSVEMDEGLRSTLEELLPQKPVLKVPEEEEQDEVPEAEEQERKQAMRALYGQSFPLAGDEEPKLGDWASWAKDLWERHEQGRKKKLHAADRNRLFRKGVQWVSSTAFSPWREPPKPVDAVRAVDNVIGPALDQRVQLIAEQRPGFRVKPTNQYDRDDRKRAEAAQAALEYQYSQQGMAGIMRETSYWNGTDGVAFWLVFWDAEAGPWHEEFQTNEAGEPVLHPIEGTPLTADRYPVGDVRTRVYRIEQVAVSANATATQRPWYWVVKETIPLAEAVAFHGQDAVEAATQQGSGTSGMDWRASGDVSNPDELLESQETVDRYTVFCEKSEFLPDGLTMVALGDREVVVTGLTCGMVPMIRVTDGSTDPAFFPTAIMDGWLDHQMRINALKSKWIESIRINAGGRFASKPKAISTETLQGGSVSVLEVRSPGPISDALMPIQGFSVGTDVKELLDREVKLFESKSGWNDASRGSLSGDASGRAIIAARESLERIFAEPIGAFSRAMTEWAQITMAWMRWGYDLPRTIGVTGKSRPDLAMELVKDDLDGVADIEVDPETMMPMPTSYEHYLLDQMLEKGAINIRQYQTRMPFGFIRDIEQPDDFHSARAQRVAQAIRSRQQPPPIMWQDDEAIHQSVLEREIILRDDQEPDIVEAANQRWIELANQAQMKQGGMPPQGGPPQGGPPQGGPQAGPMPGGPGRQPLLMNNPGVPTAPVAVTSGEQARNIGQDIKGPPQIM